MSIQETFSDHSSDHSKTDMDGVVKTLLAAARSEEPGAFGKAVRSQITGDKDFDRGVLMMAQVLGTAPKPAA